MQTPLTELNIPLKLEWKEGKKMPFGMSESIQAISIGDSVYVGGGFNTLKSKRATVMVYILSTSLWNTLLPYEHQYFGMAAVNNQLVLVGGRNILTGNVSNMLGVWDEGSQTWTHPFPDMPTSRDSPAIASYKNWLIVAGGRDERYLSFRKVELLDTSSGWWYEGSPLPSEYRCLSMSSAVNGNMWYLSRLQGVHSKSVLCVCLDELIFQAVSPSGGTASPPAPSGPSPWQTLTDLPLERSIALILNGALLAVGGELSSAIHLYQPSSRSWVKVGELPSMWWECACTVLPSGEMLVAGGCSHPTRYDRMDIATICS